KPDDHRELIEQRTKSGYKVLDTLESHIADREWFVGGSMTLADVALYAYTHVAPEGGFDLEPYPGIRNWIARVEAQPGHVAIDA
ncbi:MAG TPA: glutathione binding-like protein, partial [Gaiellaceae bacterium]|nr:glutathione binding-like protein [Gaiellaceae bacterium]